MNILDKIEQKTKGTDKEFLSETIKNCLAAKAKVKNLKTPENGRRDIVDLAVALHNVVAQGAIVACTDEKGTCSLSEEELNELSSL